MFTELVHDTGLLNGFFVGLCSDKLSTIELLLPVLLDKVSAAIWLWVFQTQSFVLNIGKIVLKEKPN